MPQTLQVATTDKLDRLLSRLDENKKAWAHLDLGRRRSLLASCLQNTMTHAEEWVEVACRKKGITLGSTQGAEEILAGPVVLVRHLRLLIETLSQIERFGSPQVKGKVREIPNSCLLSVGVFPQSILDRIAFGGIEASIWMHPDINRANFAESMASAYRNPPGDGKISLVLGAGNVSSIGPLDVLHKLFLENEVCVVKMNPVNDYLGFIFERIFGPLINEGYLGFVYGDAKIGRYLCEHPAVETIHLTGSDRTFDAIVWGADPAQRDRNKASGNKINRRPVTAELGNVSPVIVVPGPWTEKELRFHAENVAGMVANNASFNCNAAKLLVTSRDWAERGRFLEMIREILRSTQERKAYYPGAFNRYQTICAEHPEAERLSRGISEDVIPWTLIPGIDPKSDDLCFRMEPFCAIISETALEATDPQRFLLEAAQFCNEKVWGSLSAMIIIHPATEKRYPALTDAAVLELKYGTVGINVWTALGYALGVTPWGAFPGHPDEDIQSGRGFVHNTLMFDKPLKGVVRGPFRLPFRLPYFSTHKKAWPLGWNLLRLEADPGFFKLPGLVLNSIFS